MKSSGHSMVIEDDDVPVSEDEDEDKESNDSNRTVEEIHVMQPNPETEPLP